MNAYDAHGIAGRFVTDYHLMPAGAVIADLARLLGPDVVCAIANEHDQAMADDDERIRRLIASLESRKDSTQETP